MPLLEQEKSDIRRHLDYSVIGLYRQSPVGGTLAPMNTGFRILNSYGQLEYVMNNLLPNEEARLTGKSYGAIGFVNNNPVNPAVPVQVGSTMTISIFSDLFSVSPVVLSYTVVSGDTLLSICGKLALQAASNGIFTSAGFYAMNDFGAGPYGQQYNPTQLVSFPIVSFVGPMPGINFTLTVAGTGTTVPQIVQQGVPLSPSSTSNLTYPPTKTWGYVPICNYLEDQMSGATSDNLSVFKANDAVLRLSEMKDRKKLYLLYTKRLALFLGTVKNQNNPANTGVSLGGSWTIQ